MPTVTKLSPDEARAIQNKNKSQRQLVAEQYDTLLAEFELGDWGDVTLGDDEHRPTVRNRLKAAAQRRGLGLHFGRSRDDRMRFQVVAADAAEGADADDGAWAPESSEPVTTTTELVEASLTPPADPAPPPPAADPEPLAPQPAPERRRGRPRAQGETPTPPARPAVTSPPLDVPVPTAPPRRGGRTRRIRDE